MDRIKLLDCTLRDGGYVNSWDFGEEITTEIIKRLVASNVDYIEAGFLDKTYKVKGFRTRFKKAEDLNDFISKIDLKTSKVGVLIEQGKYDFKDMPYKSEENNKISAIRLAFRKSDREAAIDDLKQLIEKGYEVFAQPITTKSYTDREILDLIEDINKVGVHTLAIVDTHGSMTIEDFNRIYYLYDNNLNKDINIGFHSHNNTQLSYSLAINAIEKKGRREIIIDSSLYGMGRGAGNLNTELISEYINNKYRVKKYNTLPLIEAIECYLQSIYEEQPWGYTLSQYLSATEECHPNYAVYLLETKKMSHVSIKNILRSIPKEEKTEYNKELIEELYYVYKFKSPREVKELNNEIIESNIMLLASGHSVVDNLNEIEKIITSKNLKIIGINHKNEYLDCDFYFFSNQVRYDEFKDKISTKKLIVTSNIKTLKQHENCYTLDYKVLFEIDKNENSTIMLLKYFLMKEKSTISIAGFDGFRFLKDNYSYKEGNKIVKKEKMDSQNMRNQNSIDNLKEKIKLNFITETVYKI